MALRLKILNTVQRPRNYKKTFFAIPYVFTFGNAIFGFLSVTNALEGNITTSALFILAAAFMDGIDGRLARYFGVTSNLGMELDSLCDAVSFCLAPAILLYSNYDNASSFLVGALSLALCAGLFRLARFNTISADNKDDFFKGLPTTMAAIFIASLLYYRDIIANSFFSWILQEFWLASVVMMLAFLMASSIRFPSFKKNSLHAVVFRLLLALTAVLFAASFFYKIPVFFVTAFVYVLSGPVLVIVAYLKRFLKS